MRCLYLNHNVAGTGTYQRAFHLARELACRGHDVTLLTTSRTRRGGGTERSSGRVRIIEAPDLLAGGARNGFDPWNIAWRLGRLRRETYDLIHAFDCRPAVIVPALAQRRRTGAPLFLDWADWWGRGGTITERSGRAVQLLFGPVETWLEEAFRAGATANTTISAALRRRCTDLGVPAERILALPNGCEPPATLDHDSARAALRAGAGPLIVHVGVAQRQDAALLFGAFRLLRRAAPAARLALIGEFRGAVPGDLADAVTRTGFVPQEQLRQWLAGADAGIVPLSDTTANQARWPGKVNEYLTAGLPVVIPRVGAAADYVEGTAAGVVCAPTPGSLADGMLAIVSDTAARARMGAAGHALAAGELAWHRIAERLVDFYEQWGGAGWKATRTTAPMTVTM